MLSHLDYLVFFHAVFCTDQLYAFRRIIFSMFLRKRKLKITCPFWMGYRLTKMEDLQNALISRLFGVLHAVFCIEQLYAFRKIIFSMFLRKKKLKITCPFCMGYRLTKMEDLQNALTSRLFGVFARGFLHRTTLCIPQNHFQHVFAKKKLKKTCPFCMGYRLTKMEDLQNALTSRLFGVFARGFLHRRTLRIPQNHFQHVFAKKKG